MLLLCVCGLILNDAVARYNVRFLQLQRVLVLLLLLHFDGGLLIELEGCALRSVALIFTLVGLSLFYLE